MTNLKLIFRNIKKHKPYSFLNLFGLSLGLGLTFIALLYVLEETGYDRFNKKHERIVRVLKNNKAFGNTGSILNIKKTETFKEQIPEIEKVINFKQSFSKIGEQFTLNGYYAQPDIVDVLDFEILDGSFENFASDINAIIVSESFAFEQFGFIEVSGKFILLDKELPHEKQYIIAAVYKDLHKKSSLRPQYIIPIVNSKSYQSQRNEFGVASFNCFFLLAKEANASQIAEKMKKVFFSVSPNHPNEDYVLQPLAEIHLYSDGYNEWLSGSGSIKKVVIYAAIGLLILIISLANFVLLFTAITQRRLKEIAIRKANGLQRYGSLKMFLSESLVYSFLAAFLGLLFMSALLPLFNKYTSSNLALDFYSNLKFVSFSILILGLIGIGSGFYFANYSNKFSVIHILKNQGVRVKKKFFFRPNAVFIQTTIVVVMLIFSMTLYRQIEFMIHSDKGFNNERLLYISGVKFDFEQFKSEASQMSFIENMAFGQILPIHTGNSSGRINLISEPSRKVSTEMIWADENYIPTYQINLKSGRNFSALQPKDKKEGVIINEKAAQFLELENPIGVETNFGPIIGVIQDLKFETFKKPIRPLLFLYSKTNGVEYIVKYKEGHREDALALIEKTGYEHPDGISFISNYNTAIHEKLYGDDLVFSKAIQVLTLMAMFITIIGIIGMTMHKTAKMKKEIGIRKVNGAQTKEILWMLNKSFIFWVLAAFIFALPIAFYSVNVWLQSFSYQVSPSVVMFMLILAIVIIITIISVSIQSYYAVQANPVKSLRTE